ncbi:MAG: hypothetical protein LBP67_10945 [Bacteroidales bacterium]|jgi:hypothetical protein|nr:hypothetical protein [Bacteroidales bacterium]
MNAHKLNSLFILIMALLVKTYSSAQPADNYEKNNQDTQLLYYLHQKVGTEEQLQNYISTIIKNKKDNIDTLSDIYINFIPPMRCPRCEGLLITYNNMLKIATQDSAVIINVLLYKKPHALQKYINRQNFPGDFLFIDTSDNIYNIFTSNNNDKLLVPFVTKISIPNGRLITAKPTLGMTLDSLLIEQMINEIMFEPLHSINENLDLSLTAKTSNNLTNTERWIESLSITINKQPLLPYDSCIIPDVHALPELNSFQINHTGNELLISDFLSNSFILYSKEQNNWANPTPLSPNIEEKTMFIESGLDTSYVYYYLRDANVLVSMYLEASFTKSNQYIFASLPRLEWSGLSNITYYNMPICLIKNKNAETIRFFLLDSIAELESDKLLKLGYSFSHPTGLYFEEDSLFVFQIQKGWPVIGSEALPQIDNISDNPFLNEFYTPQLQTIMLYNHYTNSYVLAAPLDPIYEKHKLGYYYSTPIVKKFDEIYYVGDKHTGKILQLSHDYVSTDLVCDIFMLDTVIKQMHFSEDIAYIESYKIYFDKWLKDFVVINDSFYTIISDIENNYLIEIKDNHPCRIQSFPKYYRGLKIANMQFGYNEQNEHVVYGLYQDNLNAVIYTFDFK